MWTLLLLPLLVRAGDQEEGIIGGHIVAPHSKPWMACLLSKTEGAQICGGALISEKLVLTAAHCTKNHFSDVIVVLGVQNTKKSDPSWQTFRNVKPHFWGYNRVTRENDIVLLELDPPAVLNKKVRLIPLPSSDRNIPPGTVCNVAGWGRTQIKGSPSDELREVNVSVITNHQCEEALRLKNHVKDSMLCAGKQGQGKDANVFDSGGPLVCNGTVEGIVSHGTENSPPGVYTRVSKYLEWIRKVMNRPG